MTQSHADSRGFTQTGTEHSVSSTQTLKGLSLKALFNKKHTWTNKPHSKGGSFTNLDILAGHRK